MAFFVCICDFPLPSRVEGGNLEGTRSPAPRRLLPHPASPAGAAAWGGCWRWGGPPPAPDVVVRPKGEILHLIAESLGQTKVGRLRGQLFLKRTLGKHLQWKDLVIPSKTHLTFNKHLLSAKGSAGVKHVRIMNMPSLPWNRWLFLRIEHSVWYRGNSAAY